MSLASNLVLPSLSANTARQTNHSMAVADVSALAERLERDGMLRDLSILLSGLSNNDQQKQEKEQQQHQDECLKPAPALDVYSVQNNDDDDDDIIMDWADDMLDFDFDDANSINKNDGQHGNVQDESLMAAADRALAASGRTFHVSETTMTTTTSEYSKTAPSTVPSNSSTPLFHKQVSRKYKGSQWNTRFEELNAYRQQHGDCLVPYCYSPNPQLAQWVKRMRSQYKQLQKGNYSTLNVTRVEALERIGFVWDSHGNSWDERYAELVEYYEANGHCRVPIKYQANPKLALWLKTQKRHYSALNRGKKSPLTRDRLERLRLLGFGQK